MKSTRSSWSFRSTGEDTSGRLALSEINPRSQRLSVLVEPAWRQWLLGRRKTFVPGRRQRRTHLTPTGLLMEGDFTHNPSCRIVSVPISAADLVELAPWQWPRAWLRPQTVQHLEFD